ncbi:MAG: ABC transporter ATP-binding protein [Rhodospirillales bacterium]|nr:ABC transporter ATP-binding protein [Rhodospirillales bacterium]
MANDTDIAIRAEGLSKRFGDFVVVEDLNLTVKRGEIYGFLGPNGSGKTTTMRMLVGLLEPDHGRGECLGLDIRTERDALRRRIGYMTQHFSLYGDLTVEENLEFVARIYNLPAPVKTAQDAIRELGLEGRGDQLVSTLSGGWKQRLALAAAILPKPELLLLDEPTAGVDPKARRDFWEHIYELAADGLTVLVSTHYMDEAERCHRIAYLAYGKLLASGAGDEVIGNSGLSVWEVSGDPGDLSDLAANIRDEEGISMATPFGTRLRIGGPDKNALDHATQPYRDDSRFRWEPSPPTLEDVFIHLLRDAQDNRAVAS